eukprot:1510652-Amphidinium_carterae.1
MTTTTTSTATTTMSPATTMTTMTTGLVRYGVIWLGLGASHGRVESKVLRFWYISKGRSKAVNQT